MRNQVRNLATTISSAYRRDLCGINGDLNYGQVSNISDDSADEVVVRSKPPRPRKRAKEPLFDEDIVDGFAILSFKTLDDLEVNPL